MGTKHPMPTFRPTVPWSPLDLPNLLWWLRADLGITITDGKVSQWDDQSGNEKNFTQVSATYRPTLIASDANLNNNSVVSFNISWMDMYPLTQAQPIDFYMVAKQVTWSGYSYDFWRLEGGMDRYLVCGQYDSSPKIMLYSGSSFSPVVDIFAVDTYYLIQAYFNGSNSFIRKNGGSTNNGNPGTTGANNQTFRIGYAINAKIAEFIAVGGTTADSDRLKLENYVSSRYGIY